MGEVAGKEDDLVQVARLAVEGKVDDVRLYVARLARKYRTIDPALAQQLEGFLKGAPTRSAAPSPLRRSDAPPTTAVPKDLATAPPVDQDSRLSLLKTFPVTQIERPLLGPSAVAQIERVLSERGNRKQLLAAGLSPTRSAIFTGKPGVGKTLTARWMAAQLGVPLFVLDLSTVMSSYLGRSGSNLRSAIEFAKQSPCALLLDEIDSIAKKRADDSDIGELKRLVTVVLQEVDEWPDSSLLLAATNHPELIDGALWRRFDAVIEFDLPDMDGVQKALGRFLAPVAERFAKWHDILALVMLGSSFSDIEKMALSFRRSLALGSADEQTLIEDFVKSRSLTLPHDLLITLAVKLEQKNLLTQHKISEITSISRDTIRKHSAAKPTRKKGRPKA